MTNEWQLTRVSRTAGEAGAAAVRRRIALPGVPYLTDPVLDADRQRACSDSAARRSDAAAVLADRLAGRAARSAARCRLRRSPGVQLRPLSPALPARRGASRPGALTPFSIRSGVGAENDRRSVFCPSPFTKNASPGDVDHALLDRARDHARRRRSPAGSVSPQEESAARRRPVATSPSSRCSACCHDVALVLVVPRAAAAAADRARRAGTPRRRCAGRAIRCSRSAACLAISNFAASGAGAVDPRDADSRARASSRSCSDRSRARSRRPPCIGRTSRFGRRVLEVQLAVRIVLDDQHVAPLGPLEQRAAACRGRSAARSDSGSSGTT